MNEVIDIGIENFDSSSGGGLDFLMNTSGQKRNGGSIDLDSLEKELNDLSDVRPIPSSSDGDMFSSFMGGGGNSNSSEPKVGQASAEYMNANSNSSKTWDGYSKVNDASFSNAPSSSASSNTSREQQRKKRSMLKRLEELQKKGSITGLQVTQDSSFEEIEDEYNSFMEDKLKQESIKLQKQWFFNGINTMEYFNNTFNPFDMDLTGWGEKMAEDLEDDDEVFGELYEKYKGGKLAPEVKLLLKIATSAFWINITNKMISSSAPGLSDVMRQNPEVMKTFMNATVESLNSMPEMKGNPMMAFAQDMLHNEPKPNMMHGAPPPPIETKPNISKQSENESRSQSRMAASTPAGRGMQYTNRPDIMAGRGGFQEKGVEINQSFGSLNTQERTPVHHKPGASSTQTRPEMKGPSDIDEILSGLKKKENPVPPNYQPPSNYNLVTVENVTDDSLISISSLKELSGQQMPKRSKRRNRSDKNNTIVLDI